MIECGFKQTSTLADYAQLIRVFDSCFANTLNTRLICGEDEPVYLPASKTCSYHQVIFAHGFFSSALHEIAHWCLAGERRRQQLDYGYWYIADGRNTVEQQAFEVVEVKPQALEWVFSKSCGHRFRVSVDNLEGDAGEPHAFKAAVFRQLQEYCRQGLPERAEQFRQALGVFYGVHAALNADSYSLTEL